MPAAKTKKDEIKLDIALKGVSAKLQTARTILIDKGLKKSGKNDFAHFEFFQLKDFLPEAQKIFTKLGLTTNYTLMPRVVAKIEKFNDAGSIIESEPIIRDIARLVIKDIETKETEVFEMEAAPVQIGNNTKQNIYQAAGGRSTYYKRYLYRDALEIEEDDESDQVLGQANINYVDANQANPYNFQQQSVSVQQDIVNNQQISNNIQQAPVQQVQEMGTSVKINPTTEEVVVDQEDINPDAILTQNSRVEIMNIINGKNLNGFEVINKYCENNGVKSPSDLKESDKQGLLAYIDTL